MKPAPTDERSRRWRLLLGGAAESSGPSSSGASGGLPALTAADAAMDRALAALYESDHQGGLGSSCPNVARWLGDIRQYFPTSVVQLMQKDALQRLDLKQMLFEPELLQAVEPDVHLISTLLALKNVLPAKTKETARAAVQQVAKSRRRTPPQTRATHPSGCPRQPQQILPHPPPALKATQLAKSPSRNRLAPHHSRQPQTLPGPIQNHHPRNPHRLRSQRSSLRDIIVCVDQSLL